MSTTNEARKKNPEDTEPSTSKKDSTSAIPMIDLEEALNLVVKIHDNALETASMPQVAKGCGYANPTSTPFYRRLLAARLFKLLGSPQPELTPLALDYLKPDREDAKQSALTQAVVGIAPYAEAVQRHIGKKISTELVSHSFSRSLNLTDACARVCAQTFVSSLKFAGFISMDGTVAIPLSPSSQQVRTIQKPAQPEAGDGDDGGDGGGDTDAAQTQTLYLDSKRKRKITIKAPLTVSKEELERIRAWLGFQLIVEEPSSPPPATE